MTHCPSWHTWYSMVPCTEARAASVTFTLCRMTNSPEKYQTSTPNISSYFLWGSFSSAFPITSIPLPDWFSVTVVAIGPPSGVYIEYTVHPGSSSALKTNSYSLFPRFFWENVHLAGFSTWAVREKTHPIKKNKKANSPFFISCLFSIFWKTALLHTLSGFKALAAALPLKSTKIELISPVKKWRV